MTKTILVPIDFTIASLNTLKMALESCTHEQVNVVLMYAQYNDDSIAELLFYSEEKTIKQLVSDEFNEALEIIKNRFEGRLVNNISIKLFHGRNNNAFKNFVDANKIDAVYIPKTYALKISKQAFCPIALIRKSKLSVTEMEWESSHPQTEQEQLIILFN